MKNYKHYKVIVFAGRLQGQGGVNIPLGLYQKSFFGVIPANAGIP